MSKKLYFVASLLIVVSMLLAACASTATTEPAAQPTTAPAQPTTAPATVAPTEAPAATNTPAPAPATDTPAAPAATEGPTLTPTLTPYPVAKCEGGRVCVTWYIGLGTGSDAGQLPVEQSVVDDFNKSQDKVQLIMQVVPNASARDTLSTMIASGAGPDIVGPVGFSGSNAFYGQWLDLAPYIKSNNVDTSMFDASLMTMYQTEQGQVGLPFAVYPSALWYNTALFDQAGLEYPPAKYGDKYKMPDGTMVDWSWDTVAKVGQLLTVDANGKNSTEDGFDVTKVIQFGFDWQWEGHPNYWGAYWQAGTLYTGNTKGSYAAVIPDAWKASWTWTNDGIWGPKPYIVNSSYAGSADYGSGNTFSSGKIAMTTMPSWYTCCVNPLKTFDFAAMPTYNGKVGGRIDADTFRILKSTKNPNEAFQAMLYLETTGIQKLLIGDATTPAAYGAVPSIAKYRQPFLDAKMVTFPQLKNLQTLMDGLQYPDAPSAEGWTPNYNEAWSRVAQFGTLVTSTKGLDLAKEMDTLVSDLTKIFNK